MRKERKHFTPEEKVLAEMLVNPSGPCGTLQFQSSVLPGPLKESTGVLASDDEHVRGITDT
jgi:hypothetical protein